MINWNFVRGQCENDTIDRETVRSSCSVTQSLSILSIYSLSSTLYTSTLLELLISTTLLA